MRFSALFILAMFVGCSAASKRDELAPFRSLQRGMTIEQGRARVGQPTRETGSGLAIDVYQLKDGSEVWLGYAGSGGLIYVKHGDQQLLPDGGG
jgi:hypothetical protein